MSDEIKRLVTEHCAMKRKRGVLFGLLFLAISGVVYVVNSFYFAPGSHKTITASFLVGGVFGVLGLLKIGSSLLIAKRDLVSKILLHSPDKMQSYTAYIASVQASGNTTKELEFVYLYTDDNRELRLFFQKGTFDRVVLAIQEGLPHAKRNPMPNLHR